MKTARELTNQVFGKLTALVHFVQAGKSKWNCRCACGNKVDVYATHLLRGNSTSCRNCFGAPVKTLPAHASWVAMLTRCNNPNHEAYERYGGRGIKVCSDWLAFENFYRDMGVRPDGLTLDRIDSNGNYELNNCRWATRKEQSNNTSTNRRINYVGEMLTIAEVARKTGEKYHTVYSRTIRKESRNARKAYKTKNL